MGVVHLKNDAFTPPKIVESTRFFAKPQRVYTVKLREIPVQA
jgi:hypothetical protein